MKFSNKDFFSKCDQSRSFLRIWSHLLKKSSMEDSFFVQWKVWELKTNTQYVKFCWNKIVKIVQYRILARCKLIMAVSHNLLVHAIWNVFIVDFEQGFSSSVLVTFNIFIFAKFNFSILKISLLDLNFIYPGSSILEIIVYLFEINSFMHNFEKYPIIFKKSNSYDGFFLPI